MNAPSPSAIGRSGTIPLHAGERGDHKEKASVARGPRANGRSV